jgi:hypothetical protein
MDEGFGSPIKTIQSPIICADPQSSLAVLKNRAHVIGAQTLGVGGIMLVTGKSPRRRVQCGQPPVSGPDPNRPIPVLIDDEDGVVTQAMGVLRIMSVLDERVCISIELVKPPVLSSNPQPTCRILEKEGDLSTAKAARIMGILVVMDEGTGCPVKSVKTISRSNPQFSLAILENRPHEIIGQCGRIVRIMLVHGKLVSIEFVEPILCTKPHKPALVLEDNVDSALGKTVLQGNSLKTNVLAQRHR